MLKKCLARLAFSHSLRGSTYENRSSPRHLRSLQSLGRTAFLSITPEDMPRSQFEAINHPMGERELRLEAQHWRFVGDVREEPSQWNNTCTRFAL